MVSHTFFNPIFVRKEKSCRTWWWIGRRSGRSISRFLSHGVLWLCSVPTLRSRDRRGTLWERVSGRMTQNQLAGLKLRRWGRCRLGGLLGEDSRCPPLWAMRSFKSPLRRPVHTGNPKSDFPYSEACAKNKNKNKIIASSHGWLPRRWDPWRAQNKLQPSP